MEQVMDNNPLILIIMKRFILFICLLFAMQQ